MSNNKRLYREKKTIKSMIEIYCKKKHNTNKNLCDDCMLLLNYANTKINKCVFGINKPACNDCVIHCYSKEMRARIKEVMVFSGPRMFYYHPYLAIMHFVDKYRYKKLKT